MKNILSILLLLLAFTACGDQKSVTDVLNRAEAVMNEHPDSALNLLRTLTFDDFQKEKNRARYALLHSQALDKNYIDVTSDSLISVAVDYYKDTVDFVFRDADYKVVSYIDSTGCISCKLKLLKWKRMIAEVDSLTDSRVPFLFYFYTKDQKELRFFLRRDNFTYPVCFEDDDYLNRLNSFPSDMTFQTLLLDKENKVVAIGSPVLYPKIKDLYIEIITGKKKEGTDKSVTTVSMDQTEKNFGNIPLNEIREHVFKLANTGNKPLVVYDVVTSCGCTKVEYSKELVRPGDALDLKVNYHAEDKGRFRKSLRVYCNTKDSPLKFSVVGTVE